MFCLVLLRLNVNIMNCRTESIDFRLHCSSYTTFARGLRLLFYEKWRLQICCVNLKFIFCLMLLRLNGNIMNCRTESVDFRLHFIVPPIQRLLEVCGFFSIEKNECFKICCVNLKFMFCLMLLRLNGNTMNCRTESIDFRQAAAHWRKKKPHPTRATNC